MELYTGKDYDDLCAKCQKAIDDAAEVLAVAGPDTDDPEAALMWAGDHGMLCGGRHCKGEG